MSQLLCTNSFTVNSSQYSKLTCLSCTKLHYFKCILILVFPLWFFFFSLCFIMFCLSSCSRLVPFFILKITCFLSFLSCRLSSLASSHFVHVISSSCFLRFRRPFLDCVDTVIIWSYIACRDTVVLHVTRMMIDSTVTAVSLNSITFPIRCTSVSLLRRACHSARSLFFVFRIPDHLIMHL